MLPINWAVLGCVLLVSTHGYSIVHTNTRHVDLNQRIKRSPRGYMRGQTQSQYLNFGAQDNGKAEAEATENGSRATVGGNNGMGQAQSQFSAGDCSDCAISSVYEYPIGSPDPLTSIGAPYRSSLSSSDQTTPSRGISAGPGGLSGLETGSYTPAEQRGQFGTIGSASPGLNLQQNPDQYKTPGRVYDATRQPIADVAGQSVIGAQPITSHTPSTTGGLKDQSGRTGNRPGIFDSNIISPSGVGITDNLPIGAYTGRGRATPSHTHSDPATQTYSDRSQPDQPAGPYRQEMSYGRLPGTEASSSTHFDKQPPSRGRLEHPATELHRSETFPPGLNQPLSQIGAQPDSSFGPKKASGVQGSIVYPSSQGAGNAPGYNYYGRIVEEAKGTEQPGTRFVPAPGTPQGYVGQGNDNKPPYGSYTPESASGISRAPSSTDYVSSTGYPDRRHKQGQQIGTGPIPGTQLSPVFPLNSLPRAANNPEHDPSYGQGFQPSKSYGQVPQPGGIYGQGPQPIGSYGQGPQPLVQSGQGPQSSGSYGHQPLDNSRQGFQPVVNNGRVPQPSASYGQGPQHGGVTGQGSQPGEIYGHGPQPVERSEYAPQQGGTYGQGPQQGASYGQSSLPGANYVQGPLPTTSYGQISQPSASYGQGSQPAASPQLSGIYGQGPQLGEIYGQGLQPTGSYGQGTQPVVHSGQGPQSSGSYEQGPQPQGFQPVVNNGRVSQPSASYGQGSQPVGNYGQGPQHGGVTGQGASANNGQDPQQGVNYGQVSQPGGSYGQGPQQGGIYGQGPSTNNVQGSNPAAGPQQSGIYSQGTQPVTSGGQGSLPGGSYGQGTIPTVNSGQVLQGGINGEGFQPGGNYGQSPQTLVNSGERPQQGEFYGQGPQQGGTYGQGPQSFLQNGQSPQPSASYGQASQPGGMYGQGLQPSTNYGQGPQPGGIYGQSPQTIASYGQVPQTGGGYGLESRVQPGPQMITQPIGGTSYGGVQQGDILAKQPTEISAGSNAPSAIAGVEDSFSQAESAISNGQASANAQGKNNGGTAKTQVSGTYTSSGSFSASAMTSDNDRSANAQVSGSEDGAMSQSQSQGGPAQSQAQVQVNSKNGGTKASSQSGGILQQSQSEVQANDKGGLADAQSSGPGQTSSQAQIGFRPGQDEQASPGGGQASAQSGSFSGQSQSQIHGTSKFGVSYHGVAQSASGTKEQVATYREQNRELFHTISQFGNNEINTDRIAASPSSGDPGIMDITDEIKQGLNLKSSKTSKEATQINKLDDETEILNVDDDEDEEDDPYEYGDEDDYGGSNISKENQLSDANTTEKSLTTTRLTSTETVPNGFKGTVNVEKKFHTKALETHADPTDNEHNNNNSKNNNKVKGLDYGKLLAPDGYVTVTKSVTGSMDNTKNPPKDNKNFQSTYYTKSSTCGYFTFSCNIVYGENGRRKICRPKTPTNGKC